MVSETYGPFQTTSILFVSVGSLPPQFTLLCSPIFFPFIFHRLFSINNSSLLLTLLITASDMMFDIMIFQELAFTVALSVVIYFIFCKFNSWVSQERGKIQSFCCVDASEKAVLCECKDGKLEFKDLVTDSNDFIGDHLEVEDGEVKKKEVLSPVGGDGGTPHEVFDESLIRRKVQEIEVERNLEDDHPEIQVELGEIEGSSKMNEDGVVEGRAKDEILRAGSTDGEEGLFDDWEGIERTDLEKEFSSAVVFVDSKGNTDRLVDDVKMQLYGLHKVATEGPCCTPQPMAFKLSARAKWNAWQKLGDISQDVAMEQYIALLSRSITDWKDEQ
ncbi:unnamed protein product [Cuscuta epithymum]|uniref:ACB domain-containing protein n=1 Tax=Cuscuta epithymum TaxID=186058 RepID=A0AAV0D0F9_9ASTE|nr:unnamed protein product [Cuscuta epithymum]